MCVKCRVHSFCDSEEPWHSPEVVLERLVEMLAHDRRLSGRDTPRQPAVFFWEKTLATSRRELSDVHIWKPSHNTLLLPVVWTRHSFNTAVGSKKLEYGPGTIDAGVPSSLVFGGWRMVIFQLFAFYCKGVYGLYLHHGSMSTDSLAACAASGHFFTYFVGPGINQNWIIVRRGSFLP